MSFTIPSTINGVNIASLSSMVVNVVSATAPDVNAKKGIVSGLASGTAASVRYHAVSDVFDFTVWAPKTPKALPSQNAVTGLYPDIPVNTHAIVMRKGLIPALGIASIPSTLTIKFDVPAGAEVYDAPNLAAMLSVAAGLLSAKAASLYDDALTGTV